MLKKEKEMRRGKEAWRFKRFKAYLNLKQNLELFVSPSWVEQRHKEAKSELRFHPQSDPA